MALLLLWPLSLLFVLVVTVECIDKSLNRVDIFFSEGLCNATRFTVAGSVKL